MFFSNIGSVQKFGVKSVLDFFSISKKANKD